MATYNIDSLPNKYYQGDIINCPYSGTEKSITLPTGTFKLECWGAKGNCNSSTIDNYGGYSAGIYTISTTQVLYLNSGGVGGYGKTSSIGGYNGGGGANSSTSAYCHGGGGATHIALVSGLLKNLSSYKSQVLIVAGGGGGDGRETKGGKGGGINGSGSTEADYHGRGGSQTAGGEGGYEAGGFGYGGSSYSKTSNGVTGAGGGGWYGGGGGYGKNVVLYAAGGPGGGGSGYVADSTYAYSTVWLTNASTTQQSTSTNPDTTNYAGYIRITVIDIKKVSIPVNVGGTWKDSDSAYVNVGGTWKEVDSIYVNINGAWKSQ